MLINKHICAFSDDYTITLIKREKNNVPDSMITLDQRWQTFVPLADGWRWVHNNGSTLGQHLRVLDKNWKSVPIILLALKRRANVGSTYIIAQVTKVG